MTTLRCGVKGCNAEIRGMTGLQEIHNLMKHLKRKHKLRVDMQEALELRVLYEQKMEKHDE